MNKITTTLLLTIGMAAATPALAQTVEVAPADTVDVTRAETHALSSEDYAEALGIQDWDKVEDNAILPITREQAEELITKMIVAGRADSQRKLKEAEILNDFKVETLKNKLLESALKNVYTKDYEQRIDRLETMLLILLAQQNGGKLDPALVNYLLGNGNGDLASLLSGGAAQGATAPASGTTTTILPGAKGQQTIPLAPGAKADSWDHFLSQVFYAFDSSRLDAKAKVVLDNVAGWIKENKMAVELRGYASPEGNMRYNNRLSGRRVNAAADYLRTKGIADEYLHIVPSGEDTIKDTAAQYPDARRVDIRPYYGE
ncbi:OmpA family protein [Porphyromonas bennonis]|uniref:OmpA family protein n=1 Tax=Porphyromonas bennonis TaxID=501496 RepID=UPI00036F863D|nr:OmpA family protein [Porphyromonas bennonis]